MIRNHTTRFQSQRAAYHPESHAASSNTVDQDKTYVDTTKSLIRPATKNSPRPPFWINEKQNIQLNLGDANELLNRLRDMVKQVQMVGFDETAAEALQSRIRTTEEQISVHVQLCKKHLVRMSIPSKTERETPSQANVRENAYRIMMDRVNQFIPEFTHVREGYRHKGKQLEARAKESSAANKLMSMDDDDNDSVDPGFTGDQMALLVDAEKQAKERGEVIRQIHHELVEVNELFMDVSLMVKGHEHMLDRIDTNIENTVAHTGAALVENKQAEDHQRSATKKSWLLLVIALLVAGILGLIVIITVVNP
jgi:hypothetical protein